MPAVMPQENQQQAVPPGAQGAQGAPMPSTPSPSSQAHKTGNKVKEDEQHPDDKQRMQNAVRKWQGLIKSAKEKQKDVFAEMRDSMKFAAGSECGWL